ncbi:hypothetical protein BDFG_07419 [Blastomyces dermatitidis ATCC 26199]|nr:hypothetical protein BDFG_07419 [Blastomyces dermatitidis ATCC 26199]
MKDELKRTLPPARPPQLCHRTMAPGAQTRIVIGEKRSGKPCHLRGNVLLSHAHDRMAGSKGGRALRAGEGERKQGRQEEKRGRPAPPAAARTVIPPQTRRFWRAASGMRVLRRYCGRGSANFWYLLTFGGCVQIGIIQCHDPSEHPTHPSL